MVIAVARVAGVAVGIAVVSVRVRRVAIAGFGIS